MADIITLRTMTRKSKIGWGKFENRTVESVLDSQPSYLVWLYYHVQWMNFTDDILDQLRIFPEERITKPGTNDEIFEKRKYLILKSHTGAAAPFIANAYRKRKARRIAKEMENATYFSKADLQAINHGHRANRIFR